MQKLILTALLLGVSLSGFAQKKGKKAKGLEAKMTFEIIYEELPEMFEPYRAMLPKEMVSYVKGSKSRMEQGTMGVNTVTVSDSEKKTGFMLMDQMGTKNAYTMDSKDIEKEAASTADLYEATYTTETKEIAGYKCTKVDIKNKKDGTLSYAYVTKEIPGNNKTYSFLNDFALEYSIHTENDMTMVMRVKTFEKMKVADSFFEIPKDYPVKTMAEFQKEMEKLQGDGDEDDE
jgi:Domain of unknown function (DUF4412)